MPIEHWQEFAKHPTVQNANMSQKLELHQQFVGALVEAEPEGLEYYRRQAEAARDAITGKVPLGKQSWISNFYNSFMQGLAGIGYDTVKSLGIAQTAIRDFGDMLFDGSWDASDPQDTLFFKIGQKMEDWTLEMFPTDPKRQEDFFGTILPMGFGSMIGFMLPGRMVGGGAALALKGARGERYAALAGRKLVPGFKDVRSGPLGLVGRVTQMPKMSVMGTGEAATGTFLQRQAVKSLQNVARRAHWATPMALGAGVNASVQFEDAIYNDAGMKAAMAGAGIGAIVGTTEAVPIANILGRGSALKNRIWESAMMGGIEELVQEGNTEFWNNVVAKRFWDENRELMENVATSASAGGIIGFLTGAWVGYRGAHRIRRDRRNRKAYPKDTPAFMTEHQAIAEVQSIVQEANSIPDNQRTDMESDILRRFEDSDRNARQVAQDYARDHGVILAEQEEMDRMTGNVLPSGIQGEERVPGVFGLMYETRPLLMVTDEWAAQNADLVLKHKLDVVLGNYDLAQDYGESQAKARGEAVSKDEQALIDAAASTPAMKGVGGTVMAPVVVIDKEEVFTLAGHNVSQNPIIKSDHARWGKYVTDKSATYRMVVLRGQNDAGSESVYYPAGKAEILLEELIEKQWKRFRQGSTDEWDLGIQPAPDGTDPRAELLGNWQQWKLNVLSGLDRVLANKEQYEDSEIESVEHLHALITASMKEDSSGLRADAELFHDAFLVAGLGIEGTSAQGIVPNLLASFNKPLLGPPEARVVNPGAKVFRFMRDYNDSLMKEVRKQKIKSRGYKMFEIKESSEAEFVGQDQAVDDTVEGDVEYHDWRGNKKRVAKKPQPPPEEGQPPPEPGGEPDTGPEAGDSPYSGGAAPEGPPTTPPTTPADDTAEAGDSKWSPTSKPDPTTAREPEEPPPAPPEGEAEIDEIERAFLEAEAEDAAAFIEDQELYDALYTTPPEAGPEDTTVPADTVEEAVEDESTVVETVQTEAPASGVEPGQETVEKPPPVEDSDKEAARAREADSVRAQKNAKIALETGLPMTIREGTEEEREYRAGVLFGLEASNMVDVQEAAGLRAAELKAEGLAHLRVKRMTYAFRLGGRDGMYLAEMRDLRTNSLAAPEMWMNRVSQGRVGIAGRFPRLATRIGMLKMVSKPVTDPKETEGKYIPQSYDDEEGEVLTHSKTVLYPKQKERMDESRDAVTILDTSWKRPTARYNPEKPHQHLGNPAQYNFGKRQKKPTKGRIDITAKASAQDKKMPLYKMLVAWDAMRFYKAWLNGDATYVNAWGATFDIAALTRSGVLSEKQRRWIWGQINAGKLEGAYLMGDDTEVNAGPHLVLLSLVSSKIMTDEYLSLDDTLDNALWTIDVQQGEQAREVNGNMRMRVFVKQGIYEDPEEGRLMVDLLFRGDQMYAYSKGKDALDKEKGVYDMAFSLPIKWTDWHKSESQAMFKRHVLSTVFQESLVRQLYNSGYMHGPVSVIGQPRAGGTREGGMYLHGQPVEGRLFDAPRSIVEARGSEEAWDQWYRAVTDPDQVMSYDSFERQYNYLANTYKNPMQLNMLNGAKVHTGQAHLVLMPIDPGDVSRRGRARARIFFRNRNGRRNMHRDNWKGGHYYIEYTLDEAGQQGRYRQMERVSEHVNMTTGEASTPQQIATKRKIEGLQRGVTFYLVSELSKREFEAYQRGEVGLRELTATMLNQGITEAAANQKEWAQIFLREQGLENWEAWEMIADDPSVNTWMATYRISDTVAKLRENPEIAEQVKQLVPSFLRRVAADKGFLDEPDAERVRIEAAAMERAEERMRLKGESMTFGAYLTLDTVADPTSKKKNRVPLILNTRNINDYLDPGGVIRAAEGGDATMAELRNQWARNAGYADYASLKYSNAPEAKAFREFGIVQFLVSDVTRPTDKKENVVLAALQPSEGALNDDEQIDLMLQRMARDAAKLHEARGALGQDITAWSGFESDVVARIAMRQLTFDQKYRALVQRIHAARQNLTDPVSLQLFQNIMDRVQTLYRHGGKMFDVMLRWMHNDGGLMQDYGWRPPAGIATYLHEYEVQEWLEVARKDPSRTAEVRASATMILELIGDIEMLKDREGMAARLRSFANMSDEEVKDYLEGSQIDRVLQGVRDTLELSGIGTLAKNEDGSFPRSTSSAQGRAKGTGVGQEDIYEGLETSDVYLLGQNITQEADEILGFADMYTQMQLPENVPAILKEKQELLRIAAEEYRLFAEDLTNQDEDFKEKLNALRKVVLARSNMSPERYATEKLGQKLNKETGKYEYERRKWTQAEKDVVDYYATVELWQESKRNLIQAMQDFLVEDNGFTGLPLDMSQTTYRMLADSYRFLHLNVAGRPNTWMNDRLFGDAHTIAFTFMGQEYTAVRTQAGGEGRGNWIVREASGANPMTMEPLDLFDFINETEVRKGAIGGRSLKLSDIMLRAKGDGAPAYTVLKTISDVAEWDSRVPASTEELRAEAKREEQAMLREGQRPGLVVVAPNPNADARIMLNLNGGALGADEEGYLNARARGIATVTISFKGHDKLAKNKRRSKEMHRVVEMGREDLVKYWDLVQGAGRALGAGTRGLSPADNQQKQDPMFWLQYRNAAIIDLSSRVVAIGKFEKGTAVSIEELREKAYGAAGFPVNKDWRNLTSYRGIPVKYDEKLTRKRSTDENPIYIAGKHMLLKEGSVITLNPAAMQGTMDRINTKNWTNKKITLDFTFSNVDQFATFVLEHEYQHSQHRQREGESYEDYENRVNSAALHVLRRAERGYETAAGELPKAGAPRWGIHDLRGADNAEERGRLYKNYSAYAEKRGKIKPASFEKTLDKGFHVAWYSKDGTTALIGKYESGIFMVSHVAPESDRSLLSALREALDSRSPFVFAVPQHFADQLKRIGYTELTEDVPMVFRNKLVNKTVLVNKGFVRSDLPRLVSGLFAATKVPVVSRKALQKMAAAIAPNLPDSYTPASVRLTLDEAKASLTKLMRGGGITMEHLTDDQAIAFYDAASKISYMDPDNLEQLTAQAAEFLSHAVSYHESTKALHHEIKESPLYQQIYADLEQQAPGADEERTIRSINRQALRLTIQYMIEKRMQESLYQNNLISKNVWQKIKETISKVFEWLKGSDVRRTLSYIDTMIDRMWRGQNIIHRTAKPDYVLVNPETQLRKNEHVDDIVTKLAKTKRFVLTGSTAFAYQGKVYRPRNADPHDLDYRVLGEMTEEEGLALLQEWYPGTRVMYNSFTDFRLKVNDKMKLEVGKTYATQSYIVPPAGYTIENMEYAGKKLVSYDIMKGGNVVQQVRENKTDTGWVTTFSDEEGVKATFVDFFTNDEMSEDILSAGYRNGQGEDIELLIAPYSGAFEAKLRYSRVKDIFDYNRFERYENQPPRYDPDKPVVQEAEEVHLGRRRAQGGTGWGVEMAIIQGKPIWFYDQTKGEWFFYSHEVNDWVPSQTPVFEGQTAVIGSRGIDSRGKAAMREFYNKTFEKAPGMAQGGQQLEAMLADVDVRERQAYERLGLESRESTASRARAVQGHVNRRGAAAISRQENTPIHLSRSSDDRFLTRLTPDSTADVAPVVVNKTRYPSLLGAYVTMAQGRMDVPHRDNISIMVRLWRQKLMTNASLMEDLYRAGGLDYIERLRYTDDAESAWSDRGSNRSPMVRALSIAYSSLHQEMRLHERDFVDLNNFLLNRTPVRIRWSPREGTTLPGDDVASNKNLDIVLKSEDNLDFSVIGTVDHAEQDAIDLRIDQDDRTNSIANLERIDEDTLEVDDVTKALNFDSVNDPESALRHLFGVRKWTQVKAALMAKRWRRRTKAVVKNQDWDYTLEQTGVLLTRYLENTGHWPGFGLPKMTADEVREAIFKNEALGHIAHEMRTEYDKIRLWMNSFFGKLLVNQAGKEWYIDYYRNYVSHYWLADKDLQLLMEEVAHRQTKIDPEFRSSNARVFPTYYDGQVKTKGALRPRSLDAFKIFVNYTEQAGRTEMLLAAHKWFLSGKDEAGNRVGIVAKPGDSARSVPRITNHDGTPVQDSRDLFRWSKGSGTYKLRPSFFLAGPGIHVHPEYVEAYRRIFEYAPLDNKVVNGIEMFNAITKKQWLFVSFFHGVALSESGIQLMGVGNLLKYKFKPHKWALEQVKKHPALFRELTYAGVQVGPVSDLMQDQYNRMLTNMEKWTENFPGVHQFFKSYHKFSEWWDEQLWDNFHTGWKIFAYLKMKEAVVERHGIDRWQQIAPDAGKLINDAFGGLQMEVTKLGKPENIRIARNLLLAWDWTLANLRILFRPMINTMPAELRPYWLKYWMRTFMINFIGGWALQAAIKRLWGADDDDMPEDIWDNPGKFKFGYIDITPMMRQLRVPLGILAGMTDEEYLKGTRFYTHGGKQWREVVRLLYEPHKYLGPKTSPFIQIMSEQIASRSMNGWEMDWKRDSFWSNASLVKRTKHLMGQALPFSFQGITPDTAGGSFMLATPINRGMTAGMLRYAFNERLKLHLLRPDATIDSLNSLGIDLIDTALKNGLSFREIRQAMTGSQVASEEFDKYFDILNKISFYANRHGHVPPDMLENLEEQAYRLYLLDRTKEDFRRSAESRDYPEEVLDAIYIPPSRR